MIKFDDVSFSFSDVPVLKHVSFEMKDGEFVGILGPNGGGKSTFLRLALGLLKPNGGTISIRERSISYVAQTTSISDSSFPATVREAVALGLVKCKCSYKERKARLEKALNEFDLVQVQGKLVNEISGGQAQRVKIAKAIISNPSLIVLDEPDAGMDGKSHDAFLHAIEALKAKGVSLLFVSHHPHDLKRADSVYFIEDGEMIPYTQELERGHSHVDL